MTTVYTTNYLVWRARNRWSYETTWRGERWVLRVYINESIEYTRARLRAAKVPHKILGDTTFEDRVPMIEVLEWAENLLVTDLERIKLAATEE